MRTAVRVLLPLAALANGSCKPDGEPPELDVHSWAKGCYVLTSGDTWLARSGSGYGFTATARQGATPFFFQPSDLGTYLLYDPDAGYVVSEGDRVVRQTTLDSDLSLMDATYVSGAEWQLETSATDFERYQLRSRRGALLLGAEGLTADPEEAASVLFEPASGCTDHPELSIDATGTITKTTFEDGDLYGFVETHTHLFTNVGFGGGLFHGSPYHRLGVQHALSDCETVHGEMGRHDLFGAAYDGDAYDDDFAALIPDMVNGELSADDHFTVGYPEFTDWPNAADRSTHQVQYYRWLERAHLAGMRLMVQHATSNSVICHVAVGEGWVPGLNDCEDMTAVDRTIEETYALKRYIDAQSGGPGAGWFRVVTTPAEARSVITEGKLAVILGIETSDLFDCHLTPRQDGPVCDEAHVDAQLDAYFALGVRALFPNHKYDNAFTPGDGSRDFIEAGNFLNSGYYTNKVEDCPTDVPAGFDYGEVSFGGLLEPRDDYQSEPQVDMSGLPDAPIDTILPYAFDFLAEPVPGEFCQNGSLTPVGEHLLQGTMLRGMIVEVDHLPRWSYKRAFEMLEANDYPASGSHGRQYDKLYALGGVSMAGFGRCHDPENPGSALAEFNARLQAGIDAGNHPSLGISLDLNGFAGAPRARFSDGACSTPQENPVTYPFTSYDGAITFTQPVAGNRVYDYNTEGLMHVGLVPEWIQDARADATSDADLEPLFRSAEGYIRMWEKAEARGAALQIAR